MVKLTDQDDHGHLAVVESQEAYLKSTTKFLIWMYRLSSVPDVPEQRHRLQMINFSNNPSINNLHLLLLAVFAPFPTSTERKNHPLAWFVRLTSRREGGSYISLADLRHLLVHLIYAMRLVTFNELTLTPDIAYTSTERATILSTVRMRYKPFVLFWFSGV